MLERVRPNWPASTSTETPRRIEPVDLRLGVRRRGARGRREDRAIGMLAIVGFECRPDRFGGTLHLPCDPPRDFDQAAPDPTGASRRARRMISSRSVVGRVAGTASRDRPARDASSTNRFRLDSRKPTLVRPSIMNRRATSPCRRQRVTVRVETLNRRLTASTVSTGSATCSAFCRPSPRGPQRTAAGRAGRRRLRAPARATLRDGSR